MTEIYKDTENLYSYVRIDDQKFIDFDNYENLRKNFELTKQSLEYYAKLENWQSNDEDYENSVINRRDLESIIYKIKKDYWIKINTGGRVARECLKIIDEEIKNVK